MTNIWTNLLTLTAKAVPHGRCDAMVKLLKELAPADYEVTEYVAGSVLFHRPGSGRKVLFWARMDCPGFYFTGKDKKGFNRLGYGDLGSQTYENSLFKAEGDRLFAFRMEEQYGDKTTNSTPIYADFGANDEVNMPVASYAVTGIEPELLMGGRRAMAPNADIYLPCAMMLELMKTVGGDADLYFAFCDGNHGAVHASEQILPDLTVGIGAAKAKDAEVKLTDRNAIRLAKGPVIELRDRAAFFSRAAVEELEAAASGMEVQRSVINDGNYGGRIVRFAATGLNAGCVTVPVRGVATPAGIFDFGDVEAAIAILKKTAEGGAANV